MPANKQAREVVRREDQDNQLRITGHFLYGINDVKERVWDQLGVQEQQDEEDKISEQPATVATNQTVRKW
ncbi:MAG: hypothetical protein QUS14_06475 [Pyrinomonadaceae bacterium]|nr:hypothetical protein [Pyrinomonadaceae bacterium]